MSNEKIISFDEAKRGIMAKQQRNNLENPEECREIIIEVLDYRRQEAARMGEYFPNLDEIIQASKKE